MKSNFDILLEKLDGFIRKYYLNLLIKGIIFFLAGFIILLLVISALEFFGYFTTKVRFVLFYGFIGFNLFVFIRYVLLPAFGLVKIGKRISPGDAARILGTHFKKEVKDKITNALQLREYIDKNEQNTDIIRAAVEQKAAATAPFMFNKAINLKGNTRYVPYFAIPAMLGLLMSFIIPGFFSQPVERIIKYETHFEKPSPFRLFIEDDLTGFRSENLSIEVVSEGEIIPSRAEIAFGGNRYPMESKEKGKFAYTFVNLGNTFEFYVHAEGYRFGPFPVEVRVKPSFSHFSVRVKPPAYTQLQDETYMNIGDLTVAEGSQVVWQFNTLDTGEIEFLANNENIDTKRLGAGIYETEITCLEAITYKVFVKNEEVGMGDSLQYYIHVKRDQYPQIQVEGVQDSVRTAFLFHRGLIQDDYGFSKLEFAYRVGGSDRADEPDDAAAFLRENIDIDRGMLNQTFYHHFDIRTLYIKPGETVEYFYEIYDNDGINGPKSGRSRKFFFYIPDRDEIYAKTREDDERIREELSGGMGEVQEAREEIDKLRQQMLQSESLNWEQQESIRDLLERKENMEERLEQLSEFKRRSELENEQFSERNERIREKQEELQRIFEEILSEEMKELFRQIREELEKLDRNQIYDMLSRMEFEFRDLETQMDRALELFRQLEMERLLQEGIDRLQEIKAEQENIAEKTEDGNGLDELAEDQTNLAEEFDKLENILDEFRKKNEELSRPQRIDNTEELEQEIGKDMQDAGKEMEMNQQSGAQKKQQDALQKMDELSQRLLSMQSDLFMEQLAEDARALRLILENLLKSSFSQEDLLLEIRQVNPNDPRYIDFIREQGKIKDDLAMIEDSLIALSKRQVQIQSYVTREIAEIGMNLGQAIHHMIERQRAQASSRQQFVMTHVNNLALLLNESLQNMQNQLSSSGGGGGMCPSMGGSDPSFGNMRQMQQQLNEMLQQMQQGHQPLPGQTGEGQMSDSEAMARMAAEQEAIRRELEKMRDQLKQEGMGDSQELIDLQRDMERTELDIVRKQINRQTINRQERILTRLLEHEKAELQREMEERRVGNTAYDYDISNPDELFDLGRMRNQELEMLRSLPVGLRPFYRSKVENYFLNVQE